MSLTMRYHVGLTLVWGVESSNHNSKVKQNRRNTLLVQRYTRA